MNRFMKYIAVGCIALMFAPNAFAKKDKYKNKKLAQEYCKVFKDKFPKKACKVKKIGIGLLPPYCDKGWHADKTFKKGGPNYAACIKGGKLKNHTKDIGIRKGNRGSAERLNTLNCSAKEIEALNTAHSFLEKNWGAIKTEATKPTRTKEQNKNKKVIAVKTKKKQWKRLKNFITGKKAFQIECKSKKWCKNEGILGRDDLRIRNVIVCVQSHTKVKESRKAAMKAELVGTLVHELAHSANFPMYKRKIHNCSTKDKDGKKVCPKTDGTYQLDWAAQYVYVTRTTKKKSKAIRKKIFRQLLKIKRPMLPHR